MEPLRIRNNTGDHRIFKTPIAVDVKGDYEIDPDAIKSLTAKTKSSNLHRVKRATTDYNVELFMVVDYSIYKFWYDAADTSLTTSQKDAFAKTSIRQFYAFVISGVARDDSGVKESLFNHLITKDRWNRRQSIATSTWTESIKVTSSTPNQVDSSNGLNNFKNWIASTSSLPDHDHAMLFTRYDLTASSSTSNAAAHELGHSSVEDWNLNRIATKGKFLIYSKYILKHIFTLGALHDGDGNNACDRNDAFIMAASTSFPTGSTAQNPWKFSSCSVTYFQTLINNLNSVEALSVN
ncbi:hypothetical protein KUTeg_001912 [Tegillarca granosa]|uniref:Peptidase M12B domain-containing protein n=1 Tax=Tegillarca granosa TaxID=220873 RepID=A0ABQ9FX59_TEGGR|nr:hypothetical protein KUTeg_001912 [Tegillarca granosa]